MMPSTDPVIRHARSVVPGEEEITFYFLISFYFHIIIVHHSPLIVYCRDFSVETTVLRRLDFPQKEFLAHCTIVARQVCIICFKNSFALLLSKYSQQVFTDLINQVSRISYGNPQRFTSRVHILQLKQTSQTIEHIHKQEYQYGIRSYIK